MTARKTQTIVSHSAEQMFDLVADVSKYPEFLPWCLALRIVAHEVGEDEESLTADMVVAYKVFREKFRSRVNLHRRNYTIDVDYMDGPFRTLSNSWRFTDLPEGGSQVDFEIEFSFKSFILQTTALTMFEKAFSRMSEAFVERADAIYG